ncbi:MAG TPA: DUF6328 family protein [Steroidobacteraceae bacterium]|nr:DUF6328 family protein [Steroidobacteraceae bacterium]
MSERDSLLKVSLDELRMQMLGTQVLFGFQFQSLFQERFAPGDELVRAAALSGMIAMVLTIGLLIAAPAVHRIADAGQATRRTRSLTSTLARSALITLPVGLACAVLVTVATQFGNRVALVAAVIAVSAGLLAWQGWGILLRRHSRPSSRSRSMQEKSASVHDRIDYLLTESRVMLPGAQALLGFQLIVPLTKSFEALSDAAKTVHFFALIFIAVAVIVLITPAAVHRIAFGGADDERFLRLASRIVTVALVPLALGVASELYVATSRLLPGSNAPIWTATGAACVLFGLWYAMPLALRMRAAGERRLGATS